MRKAKKLERKLNGEYTNKLKSFWKQLKDFILVLFLFNLLINLVGKINISDIMEGSTIHIINEPVRASNKEAKQEDNLGVAPQNDRLVKLYQGEFSAYTASVEETDADPFTTASGEKVRDGIIANNCLKFGSKVKVNGKVFEVKDRMNSRYDCEHFDIFLADKGEARKFGRQKLDYEIL
jgi:3D (Asp-Asp-Asp) domain-containing protein